MSTPNITREEMKTKQVTDFLNVPIAEIPVFEYFNLPECVFRGTAAKIQVEEVGENKLPCLKLTFAIQEILETKDGSAVELPEDAEVTYSVMGGFGASNFAVNCADAIAALGSATLAEFLETLASNNTEVIIVNSIRKYKDKQGEQRQNSQIANMSIVG